MNKGFTKPYRRWPLNTKKSQVNNGFTKPFKKWPLNTRKSKVNKGWTRPMGSGPTTNYVTNNGEVIHREFTHVPYWGRETDLERRRRKYITKNWDIKAAMPWGRETELEKKRREYITKNWDREAVMLGKKNRRKNIFELSKRRW